MSELGTWHVSTNAKLLPHLAETPLLGLFRFLPHLERPFHFLGVFTAFHQILIDRSGARDRTTPLFRRRPRAGHF